MQRDKESFGTAAQWRRPNFREAALRALSEGAPERTADELLDSVTKLAERSFAAGLREASGGANGIANQLGRSDPSVENLLLYAAACEDAAEELDPRRLGDGELVF